MTPKPETLLAHKCEKWVTANGGYCLKLHGNEMQRAGEPDLIGGILVCPPDRKIPVYVHFAIELKVGDNMPTVLQLYRLQAWRTQGYAAGVAWSLDEFIDIIAKHVLNPPTPSSLMVSWQMPVRIYNDNNN